MCSGGGYSTNVVQAEETVTPAVAKSVSQDVSNATESQAQARQKMRGIRSTYANRTSSSSSSNSTGSANKLG